MEGYGYQRLCVQATVEQRAALDRHFGGMAVKIDAVQGEGRDVRYHYVFRDPIESRQMGALSAILMNVGVQSFEFSKVDRTNARVIKGRF